MTHLIDQWGGVIEVKGEMMTSFPYTSHPTVSTVSASTFRDRLGGCYVLSGRAVAFEAMGDLVHGSIEGGGHPRNPHAWVVLPNGDIHDPVMDTTMTAPMWEAFANPIEEVRYTPAQVNSIIADTGHWGPWHTTGSLAVADGGVRRSASAWRGFSDSPIWREHDAVILTQFRGRKRYFEVYVRGELVGTFPTLAAAREQMWVWYGDSLDWQRRTMPKVEVLHYWFGWTDEFTDPLTVYVTKVPSLLATSSSSTFAHPSR